jgi:hypothetical protein
MPNTGEFIPERRDVVLKIDLFHKNPEFIANKGLLLKNLTLRIYKIFCLPISQPYLKIN